MNSFLQEVPLEIRPRERLLDFGASALSTSELLAILFRTGTQDMNVLELANEFLRHFASLNAIKHASRAEFQQVKGIGQVKAIELEAMIELGQRLARSTIPKGAAITSTSQAGQALLAELTDLHQEHLYVLFLNTKNEVIHKKTLFIGTIHSSVAHPREIFKEACKYPTVRLIIAHNHPSGDCTPSPADLTFTRRMIACGELMGIEVLDHIIIGDQTFYSILEETNVFT